VSLRIGHLMQRRTAAHRRQKRHLIPLGENIGRTGELVITRHHNAARHPPELRKLSGIMIENRPNTGAGGKFETVFRPSADVLQKTEKKHFDLQATGSLTDPVQSKSVSDHTTHIRVRYAETDQMGVVYHANYLIWMEVARTELCKHSGFRYRDMESGDGILLAVTEANVRYLAAARYDEEIAVTARIADANRRFVTFEYEMRCEGRKVATGYTKHIFLSRDMRPVRLPDKYAPLFGIE